MSGVEIIAVLGIGASVIQIAEFCSKIVSRVQEYRLFQDLAVQLPLISHQIQFLKSPRYQQQLENPTTALLTPVLQECYEHLQRLDCLVQSVTQTADSSKTKRILKAVLSFPKDSEIQRILSKLWICVSVIRLHISCSNTQTLFLIHEDVRNLDSKIKTNQTPNVGLLSANNRSEQIKATTFNISQKKSQRRIQKTTSLYCACGPFTCPCHSQLKNSHTSGIMAKIWFSAPIVSCNCNAHYYNWSLFIFRKFFCANLFLLWEQGFSVGYSLRYSATVDCTSPGFVILYQCSIGLMDFPQARDELRELRHQGQISFDDIDRYGKSWTEVILEFPPSLTVLRTEHGANNRSETDSISLATWISR
jgi:N-terminal domain on NACHT_NTPase and P-loop NTPases